jgi:cyclohexadieny/prephenate dehydrogenase
MNLRMQLHTLTIVGVGLIGGSIGLAAKKRGIAHHIRGVGRDPCKLRHAQQLGAIDSFTLDLAEAIRDANLIVFCTPVNRIAQQVLSVRDDYAPGAVITDAGSTKANIVEEITNSLNNHAGFVGSHPLAGSEKQGAEHGSADLFVNRWTVLTPVEKTAPDALRRVVAFWQSLGSKTRTMSPEEHDRALAMTSHLPHLVAAALAGILPDGWRELTATGFRDTTRIAGGDPGVWTPIFQHNHAAILTALAQLEERLTAFRSALTDHDDSRLDQLLAQGKKVRDALGS